MKPTLRFALATAAALAMTLGIGCSAQADQTTDKIKAAPHRFVGQEVLHLSSAPTSNEDRLVRRNVVLRSFAVRSGESYTAMLGGLARVTDDSSERRGVFVTDHAASAGRTRANGRQDPALSSLREDLDQLADRVARIERILTDGSGTEADPP